eukprot:GHVR01146944.1.p1 GENE.GHVR01146944.1~~GHVR01146944.1.p1  ORF type:complete len:127 (-),score=19.79 GHVR01146944.1:53-376(-)
MQYRGYNKGHRTTNPDLLFDPQTPSPLRPPKVPWRTLLMAIFLFIVGTVFLLMGLNVIVQFRYGECIPFMIIGCICFIPGSYYVFMFIQIFRGIKGYNYDDIPSYDD